MRPTRVLLIALISAVSLAANQAAPPATRPTPPTNPEWSRPVPRPPSGAIGLRVLLVGGGSSHDFARYFGAQDKATLTSQVGWVDFTQNANAAPEVLANVDVLVWSANQPVNEDTAKALLSYAAAGKGLVLLHPGVWYNWKGFPQWNKEIVGGGARGHDAINEFEVVVTAQDHPVMAGVAKSFKVTDELYNMIWDPEGSPIEVLATATSPMTSKTFPSVWIVKHPKARIVCIAIGHDGRVHELADYKRLLLNAVKWAAGK